MPDTTKVVINLATGLEDGERVTVALLVAGAALEQGGVQVVGPHRSRMTHDVVNAGDAVEVEHLDGVTRGRRRVELVERCRRGTGGAEAVGARRRPPPPP